MVAGRVASCSHVAISSTRVMGTCSVMGQALGTAAALACGLGIMPHEVSAHMGELQQQLLADDVFLPGVAKAMSDETMTAELAASDGDPEPLRDGIHRQISRDPFVWMKKSKFSKAEAAELAAYDSHSWCAQAGDDVAYHFPRATYVKDVTMILDSNMERSIALKGPGWQEAFPESLPKRFRLEVKRSGNWESVAVVENNSQRHVVLAVGEETTGVRFVLDETHGGERSHVYGFHVNTPDGANA
jgi:hypothetical protein